MSPSPFIVTEHTADCQYIREYPRATSTQDAPLKLLLKKYTPVDNQNPEPGDVTLVAAPGTAFPMEVYEPLWEDLLARSAHDGFRIRAIWIANSFHQGASGVYNEKHLGNDPSWFDNSRDMLQMIQQFRDDMPQPIMGIGHSAGAAAQIFLSLLHPRLLTSLILIEPFIHDGRSPEKRLWIYARARQNDVWPSRDEAIQRSRKFFGTWDPRAQERYIKYGFRELPTGLYTEQAAERGLQNQSQNQKAVALTTPVSQEVLVYDRPNLRRHKQLGLPDGRDDNSVYGPSPPHDPLVMPDMVGGMWARQLSYRAEPAISWRLLPHVRPGALFVSGSESTLSKEGLQRVAAERTGTGIGGSGGMEYMRVQQVVMQGAGHSMPMERVGETAAAIGPWIAKEVQRWRDDEKRIQDGWKDLSVKERIGFSKDWKRVLEISAATHPRRAKAEPSPNSKL